MDSTLTPQRLLTAAVTGLGCTLYYASPDIFASRTTRAWFKTGVVGAILAATAPAMRDDLAAVKKAKTEAQAAIRDLEAEAAVRDLDAEAEAAVRDLDAEAEAAVRDLEADATSPIQPQHPTQPDQSARELIAGAPTQRKVAMGVGAAVALGAGIALTAAFEKGIYRRGEKRALRGKRFAHTAPALAYGAASLALSLLPVPDSAARDA